MAFSTPNPSASVIANLISLVTTPPLVDLSSVHFAQAIVQQLLLSSGAGERMARLVKADLLESSLLNAAEVIISAEQYRYLSRAAIRARFLALHLQIAIISWLRDRAINEAELTSLVLCEKNIISAER